MLNDLRCALQLIDLRNAFLRSKQWFPKIGNRKMVSFGSVNVGILTKVKVELGKDFADCIFCINYVQCSPILLHGNALKLH